MIPEPFFDLTAWIENFWIPLALALVIGVTAGAWKLWTSRRNAHHKADADARLIASREFSKAATQIGSLRMYEFGRNFHDHQDLAQKQDKCLEIIMQTAYGPAAKIARNAGGVTLSRLAVTAASMAVGNLGRFAVTYKRTQLEYLNGDTTKTPGSRLDLMVWTGTYNFAARVLDPHRLTLMGFLRLALKSTRRVEDIIGVEGHVLKKAPLHRRLKWIFSM